MNTYYREIKAKKAKFGFDLGSLSLYSVVTMGEFITRLGTNFDETQYKIEESGWGSSSVVKVYTDEEEVANFIRSYAP